jgi:hypothetical protein
VGGNVGTGILLTDFAGIGVGFAGLALIVAAVALVLRRSGAGPAGHRDLADNAESLAA